MKYTIVIWPDQLDTVNTWSFFLTHDGYPTTMTSLTLGDAPTGECDNHWCLQTLRCEWCHLSAQELAGGFCYVPFFFLFGGGRCFFFLRLHIIHHHCFFGGRGLKSCFFFFWLNQAPFVWCNSLVGTFKNIANPEEDGCVFRCAKSDLFSPKELQASEGFAVPKTNVEPQKQWWFVDVSPFPSNHFQVPC